MTVTLIVAIYLAVYFPVARRAYIWFDEKPNVDPFNRDSDGVNMVCSAAVALLWPLWLVFWIVGRVWRATIGRETPRQRRLRLEREAKSARDEAEKHGLPMPDIEVR